MCVVLWGLLRGEMCPHAVQLALATDRVGTLQVDRSMIGAQRAIAALGRQREEVEIWESRPIGLTETSRLLEEL